MISNVPFALYFMVAWSLFESKCFDGYMQLGTIVAAADKAISNGFVASEFIDDTTYFHTRYQDRRHYSNLVHNHSMPLLCRLLAQPLQSLTDMEQVSLLLTVVYRYRNNIFHGNKGIASWLQFREQIERCTRIMQALVLQAEKRRPTMPERQAAWLKS